MPTTEPRTLRIGGVEISVTLDRLLAERIKSSRVYRTLGRSDSPEVVFDGDEPVLNGTRLEDIDWYHTIDLPDGITTPGFVDHRAEVDQYLLPERLDGKRCLDVATFDGFWALEMERRGAAEVVGIDVHRLADCDFPENFREEYLRARPTDVKGRGFAYAKRALGSSIRRRVLSVYELAPDRVGTFDFVFLSDLLIHLRDPLRALEAVRTVVAPGGEFMLAELFDEELEALDGVTGTRFMVGLDDYSGCFWWQPTTAALVAMLRVARFEDVEILATPTLHWRDGSGTKAVIRARVPE